MRADEAARDGVQTVASRIVGRRSAGLEQRRLEQLVQRYFGRVATGRKQGRAMSRRRQ